jgi:hypothetical protein
MPLCSTDLYHADFFALPSTLPALMINTVSCGGRDR